MKKVFYVMEINLNGHYKRMIDVWSTRQKAEASADELNRGRSRWIELNFIHKVYEADLDPEQRYPERAGVVRKGGSFFYVRSGGTRLSSQSRPLCPARIPEWKPK